MSFQPSHITWLFDDFWPTMEGRVAHRARCLELARDLTDEFARHGNDYDTLLRVLNGYPGIGPTLASGLIYAYDCTLEVPIGAVPFDRYTMGHAIALRIVGSPCITGSGYLRACKSVVRYVRKEGLPNVEAFVRQADKTTYPLPPT